MRAAGRLLAIGHERAHELRKRSGRKTQEMRKKNARAATRSRSRFFTETYSV